MSAKLTKVVTVMRCA